MNEQRNMCVEAGGLASGPACVELKRIDPTANMRRFYRMSLQPDLFGGVDLVREWGRIGCAGRYLVEQHRSEDEAIASMHARETAKRKRGYRSVTN
jgi:predicted DNA-binding WGR domain protein